MEAHYDETLIAALAAAEKQVQQSYRPVISVHKWFARRPGTLFRGLALAELEERPLGEHYFEPHDFDGVCLDPFMGGGTTMFEANRIGLSVVGYDTNPDGALAGRTRARAARHRALRGRGRAHCGRC
jgi:hypothetical protein